MSFLADCPICLGTINQPVVTKCGHLFCKDCMEECFSGKIVVKCPTCRKLMRNTELIPVQLPRQRLGTGIDGNSLNNTDSGNSYGRWTELHEAVEFGDIHKVGQLIDSGSDIRLNSDERNKGRCPIHIASELGYLEIVKLLIKKDGTLAKSRTTTQGLLPVHSAALAGKLPIVVYFIEELSVDIESRITSLGRSLLHCASEKGHLHILKYLLKRRAKIRARSNAKDGRNVPIHLAAYFGHLNIVRYFVENVDIELVLVKNENGAIPFHRACLQGKLDVAEYLLNTGRIDIDLKTVKVERTPLNLACQSGNLDLVKFLIDRGANVRLSGMDGKTNLHFAAYCGHLAIVKHLLMLVPSLLNIKDSKGEAALDWARQSSRHGAYEVVEYLQ